VNAGGHDKVAIAVYKGDCDAGVTFVDTRTDKSYKLYETYPDIATKLKVFYLSDRIRMMVSNTSRSSIPKSRQRSPKGCWQWLPIQVAFRS
jgi:ABC-type phosphate/phosphonate transport system substrate-binding protein